LLPELANHLAGQASTNTWLCAQILYWEIQTQRSVCQCLSSMPLPNTSNDFVNPFKLECWIVLGLCCQRVVLTNLTIIPQQNAQQVKLRLVLVPFSSTDVHKLWNCICFSAGTGFYLSYPNPVAGNCCMAIIASIKYCGSRSQTHAYYLEQFSLKLQSAQSTNLDARIKDDVAHKTELIHQ
jgi:hypothetical protein